MQSYIKPTLLQWSNCPTGSFWVFGKSPIISSRRLADIADIAQMEAVWRQLVGWVPECDPLLSSYLPPPLTLSPSLSMCSLSATRVVKCKEHISLKLLSM